MRFARVVFALQRGIEFMHIVRMIRSGVVLAGLAFFATTILPGCGDTTEESGSQIKVDPAEQAARTKKIEDMYKSKSQQTRGVAAPGAGGSGAPAGGPAAKQ
jgi:hypothetical protein